MKNLFICKIEELYNLILQPISNIYKKTAINNYKNYFNIDENVTFGQLYSEMLDNKDTGVVYTPEYISLYMIKNTLTDEDIINNPYIKIVDPSCGCGNIIIPCFNYLQKLYIKNLKKINEKNNLNLNKNNLNKHIIENNIYGIDIDNIAIKILIIDMFYLSNEICKNLENKDFLIDNSKCKFDVFIGNPPYIGHKDIGKEYFLNLKKEYKDIYKNKGDISYCFFKAAYDKSNENSKITFITSRYFLESQSGKDLRSYINHKFNLIRIIDFYGIRPFKKVGIDPVIIFASTSLNDRKSDHIEIIKPIINVKNAKKRFTDALFINEQSNEYKKFYMSKEELKNNRWMLQTKEHLNIIRKIEKSCKLYLKDICISNQGIITGCDKAFIVDKDEVNSLEKEILRPWIKSSYIQKEKTDDIDKFIIYSNDIKNIDQYINIKNHLSKYKEKLMKRRECKNGIRKWYELQWGREKNIFEREKIIFPYKSSKNKFILDKGNYFSADIYCMILKEHMGYDYNFLINLLNSKVYQFYFQSFGKKLGENLFEYYPNTLMDLKIPPCLHELNNEESMYKFFNLTKCEIDLITKFTS